MAQRTGPHGLLAPKAKIASAGLLPALAIAALLALAGCGGGGEDTTSTQSPAASQAQQQDRGSGSADLAAKEGSNSGAKPSGFTAASSPDAKQAPAVAVPKNEGERERLATPAEEEELTVADIALWSPGLRAKEGSVASLPSTYTCDGKNRWLALRWQGVPAGTQELIIFAMAVQPVGGKLVYHWAVGGLDPALEGIEAGRLPKGAFTGTNSFGRTGYEICPQGSETYVFALFALPRRLSPRQGFDPSALREQALDALGNAGLLAVSYSRD